MKTTLKILSLWALSGLLGLQLVYSAVKYVKPRATVTKAHFAYSVFGGPATILLGISSWCAIGLAELENLIYELNMNKNPDKILIQQLEDHDKLIQPEWHVKEAKRILEMKDEV